MKVLMIEDEVRKARGLVAFMRQVRGWEVHLERTAKGGLERLRELHDNLDVVILDIMMPPDESVSAADSELGTATGLLLLDGLSEASRGRVPVIVFSALQDLDYLRGDRRVALYVPKPRTAEELCLAVEEVATSDGEVRGDD